MKDTIISCIIATAICLAVLYVFLQKRKEKNYERALDLLKDRRFADAARLLESCASYSYPDGEYCLAYAYAGMGEVERCAEVLRKLQLEGKVHEELTVLLAWLKGNRSADVPMQDLLLAADAAYLEVEQPFDFEEGTDEGIAEGNRRIEWAQLFALREIRLVLSPREPSMSKPCLSHDVAPFFDWVVAIRASRY